MRCTMTPIPLTPEEDELLNILEGRRPQDLERFQSLIALLMERHWYALVTHSVDNPGLRVRRLQPAECAPFPLCS